MLSEKDLSASLQAFVDGSNYRAQDVLGVHREKRAEGEGFAFRVWAPHAQQVWLVGDFNQWDEHSLPMQKDQYGVWSIFTDQAQAGQLYKFNIKQSTGREIMKIDPFAVCFEQLAWRPASSIFPTENGKTAYGGDGKNASIILIVRLIFMRCMPAHGAFMKTVLPMILVI